MTSFCSLNIFCLFHLYFSTVSLYVFHAFINFLISQRTLMVSTFEVSVLLTRIECLHIHVEMKYREISVSRLSWPGPYLKAVVIQFVGIRVSLPLWRIQGDFWKNKERKRKDKLFQQKTRLKRTPAQCKNRRRGWSVEDRLKMTESWKDWHKLYVARSRHLVTELRSQEESWKGFLWGAIYFKNSLFGNPFCLQSGNGREKEQVWKQQD